tara:strand:+ start:1071 stop:1271 length:201 start_codon:yes stop_codon:yes gene_type:complete
MDPANLKADLEKAISGFCSLNREEYLKAIKRLDASTKDASLPKQLQHYLSRRSYHKAKDLLDASDS